MIIKENTITEFIQHSTGFTISESDLTSRKVVVNNIEITSIEDWNKVTKSLIELQQENKELQNKIDRAIEYIETATIDPQSMRHYRNCLLEILKDSDVDE